MTQLPSFIIFTSTPSTEEEGKIVLAFDYAGVIPLVDAVHHSDFYWFKRNFSSIPHRFYHVNEDQVICFTVEDMGEEMTLSPDLAVYFLEGTENIDWSIIEGWLNYNITPNGKYKFPEIIQLSEKFKTEYPIPEKQVQTLNQIDKDSPEDNKEYKFRLCLIEDQDICLYEVIKPHTDLPYTSVTKHFSKIGHKQFFGDLFICESWGVSSLDIEFLRKVWKYLQLPEPYDPEEVYRERVNACFPEPTQIPTCEPLVYRRSLEEVHQRILDNAHGLECVHIGKRHRGKLTRK
jgi:hypothetical protein